ncbi:MAG: UvrD-helicase domain-containing protein, partial [Acutalibacteraceae bacterium]|nr:UvrD-helicase domain-containing protein [Acutalibacteraceae bacterium]
DADGNPLYSILDESISINPMTTITEIMLSHTWDAKPVTYLDMATGQNVTEEAYLKYMNDYSLYDNLCELAKRWQTTIADEMFKLYQLNENNLSNLVAIRMLQEQLRFMQCYNLNLNQYADIFAKLEPIMTSDQIRSLTSANINLLLFSTIEKLSQVQYTPIVPTTEPLESYLSFKPTKEQARAITAAEPLVVIQAGAGTGKSTTLRSRLKFMEKSGIKMENVLVLSFTVNAADHISELVPGIKSMTIDKMVNEMYTVNHPKHQLSNDEGYPGEGSTFINSLQQYKSSHPAADMLIRATQEITKHNNYTPMLSLCETMHDDVVDLLDKIEQTTFSLSTILAYVEGVPAQNPLGDIRYMLIDEAQDTSVFQFIYALSVAYELKCQLYLVGDATQTLYEFRAARAEALHALETSGLFATYPLSVNYRSTQAILDFDNMLSVNMLINADGHMQLQSQNLLPYTKSDLEFAVTADYHVLRKMSDAKAEILDTIYDKIKPWIDERIKMDDAIEASGEKLKDRRFGFLAP